MSKDKAFGDGAAVLAIESEDKEVDKKQEEAQQEEKSEELEKKIQELKNTAAERVAEVQDGLSKLMAQTDGWDAEGQPEYKKIMRETISGHLQKAIKHDIKDDGLAFIQGSYYEEALQAFDLLEKRIARINILEEEKNPKNIEMMMRLAEGPLTFSGVENIGKSRKPGYELASWENIAK